jgi:hypothetical protein
MFLVVGLIWIGQGTGKIGGSFMSNQPFWAYAGVGLVVLALVIAVRQWRAGSDADRS